MPSAKSPMRSRLLLILTIDGYRRQQREKILALAVDRQLVGIDHFFAAAHFERQFAVPLEQGG